MVFVTLPQFAFTQLSSIPEEKNHFLSFDQYCENVQEETCLELSLKVCRKWSELVLQRSTEFHAVFMNDGISKLILLYTGEFHKCCKIAAKKEFVFCPPPLGKPNPQKKSDPIFMIRRERIIQKPQKGMTCWYYAMNMVAQRIGKKPLPCQKDDRRVELLVSKRRKAYTALDGYYLHRSFAQNLAMQGKVSCISKDLLKNILNRYSKYYPQLKDENGEWSSIIKKFFSQNIQEDFINFTKVLIAQASLVIDRNFLIASGVKKTIQEYYQERIEPIYRKSWTELNFIEQQSFIKTFTDNQCFLLRGLQESYWHPNQEIDSLIQELWLHGPHMVVGTLEKDCYKDAPILLKEKIRGRNIYAWSDEARRQESGMSHVLVIVGANKALKSVYYIDPLDEANPKKPSLARIYRTSYETLKENITNLWLGMSVINPHTYKPIFTPIKLNCPNEYAMHGNPRLNYY